MTLLGLMLLHPQTVIADGRDGADRRSISRSWRRSSGRRTFVRSPEQLARLFWILLLCSGANAVVGVLQVYDPARWLPAEFSRVITQSTIGLGAVTYIGANGQQIVRPPGLFDTPGAVAGPAMFAALLGLVFAVSAIPVWKRALSLLIAGAGFAAIYLSQVRDQPGGRGRDACGLRAGRCSGRGAWRARRSSGCSPVGVRGLELVARAHPGRASDCGTGQVALRRRSTRGLSAGARGTAQIHLRRAAVSISIRRRSGSLGDGRRIFRLERSEQPADLGGDPVHRLDDRRRRADDRAVPRRADRGRAVSVSTWRSCRSIRGLARARRSCSRPASGLP